MRFLLWVIAIFCLALWSGLAWAGHAFMGAAAALLPAEPIVGTSAADWTLWLAGIGQGAVLLVWALGALAIIAAPLIVGRALSVSKGLMKGFRGSRSGYRSPSGRYGSPIVARLTERVAGRYGSRLLRLTRR
jgi:hypothetical protein